MNLTDWIALGMGATVMAAFVNPILENVQPSPKAMTGTASAVRIEREALLFSRFACSPFRHSQ